MTYGESNIKIITEEVNLHTCLRHAPSDQTTTLQNLKTSGEPSGFVRA
jgi:hypothetical protein